MDAPLRLAEFVATLALAQDNAFGQPLESQLRSCLLASWICEAAGVEEQVCEDAYWVALLRYVGCTGHAHEVATVFGDEIAIRAQTLVHDAANPTEVMGDVVTFATAGRSDEERDEIIRMLQETAHEWAVLQLHLGMRGGRHARRSASSSAPGCARRWRCTFERWNGKGFPAHVGGRGDPAARCASCTSATTWRRSAGSSRRPRARGREDRRGRTYDPALADLFVAHGRDVVRAARARSSRGTRCSPSSREPRRVLDARGARPGAGRRRGLHRHEVAVHGRPQPPMRAARDRRRPRPRAAGGRRSPRWAARRSCTTSAPPRSRTRSGTSRARSPARSSTASSSTPC